MNTYCRYIVWSLLTTWILWSCGTQAEEGTVPDNTTLSPYFFVHSDQPGLDPLPLKSTEVETVISGVIADVTVRQHYKNEGRRSIEAQYVFPGSTRSAVYGLTLHVGERTIEAQIRERQQARTEYQQAKSAGKSAALLEQHRPNVFQMNVANILPGDDIQVELHYTELLVPTEGTYQFVYPTVVGPRYSTYPEKNAPTSEKWVANPYLHEGQPPTSTFHFTCAIHSGIPLQEVSSPSHAIETRFEDTHRAVVTLQKTAQNENNRDVIVQYRLQGQQIESGLLLYQGEKENFFLAMVEPPASVKPEAIPPREYVFVLDVSGSMHGFPLDTAKTLLHDLISRLKPEDTFNVLLFSGVSNLLSQHSLSANVDNLHNAVAFIDAQQGGGGTELLSALKQAMAIPVDVNRSRNIVVITDGYVAVETETFDLIRTHLGQANVFAFGIGSAVNRFLVEGIAKAGLGESFIVTEPDKASAEAERFRHYIESPALTHITASFAGFDVYDVQPVSIPDLFAHRPVIVFGKWRGEKAGTFTLSGTSGAGLFKKTVDLSQVETRSDHAGLRYLWARNRLTDLSDYEKVERNTERAQEITTLGLTYNLLTSHTSFIAIDTLVRNTQPNQSITLKQPLPLPSGVSDLAVGGVVPSGPEPETWLLFSAASAVFYWAKKRQVCRD